MKLFEMFSEEGIVQETREGIALGGGQQEIEEAGNGLSANERDDNLEDNNLIPFSQIKRNFKFYKANNPELALVKTGPNRYRKALRRLKGGAINFKINPDEMVIPYNKANAGLEEAKLDYDTFIGKDLPRWKIKFTSTDSFHPKTVTFKTKETDPDKVARMFASKKHPELRVDKVISATPIKDEANEEVVPIDSNMNDHEYYEKEGYKFWDNETGELFTDDPNAEEEDPNWRDKLEPLGQDDDEDINGEDPRVNYNLLARKIAEKASEVFPDGDPFDALMPYINKLKSIGLDPMTHLDIAANKYLGVKDYHDYLATFYDDATPGGSDSHENPWRAQ